MIVKISGTALNRILKLMLYWLSFKIDGAGVIKFYIRNIIYIFFITHDVVRSMHIGYLDFSKEIQILFFNSYEFDFFQDYRKFTWPLILGPVKLIKIHVYRSKHYIYY